VKKCGSSPQFSIAMYFNLSTNNVDNTLVNSVAEAQHFGAAASLSAH
jgi:hypothetical protein